MHRNTRAHNKYINILLKCTPKKRAHRRGDIIKFHIKKHCEEITTKTCTNTEKHTQNAQNYGKIIELHIKKHCEEFIAKTYTKHTKTYTKRTKTCTT